MQCDSCSRWAHFECVQYEKDSGTQYICRKCAWTWKTCFFFNLYLIWFDFSFLFYMSSTRSAQHKWVDKTPKQKKKGTNNILIVIVLYFHLKKISNIFILFSYFVLFFICCNWHFVVVCDFYYYYYYNYYFIFINPNVHLKFYKSLTIYVWNIEWMNEWINESLKKKLNCEELCWSPGLFDRMLLDYQNMLPLKY